MSPKQQDGISIREILYRIFARFPLFLACVITVPLITIYMAYLIPPQYEAKAKILIRHNDTSSFAENNKAPSQQTNMSSQSIVEILTSLPVSEKVVKEMNVKAKDIAKPSYKVLMGYLARIYYFVIPQESSDESMAVGNIATSLLAKDLANSIHPKITDKGQAGFLRDDELIEVRVKSFNHRTVAGVTNKICKEFINEYYKIFEEDAGRTYHYLNQQIAIAEKSPERVAFQNINQPIAITGRNPNGPSFRTHPDNMAKESSWTSKDVTTNPIVARTSRQIAEMERELSRLRTIYADDSLEIKQIEAELVAANQRLKTYKNQESTESILNALKERRRQAYIILQVYQNKLIPISIIEEAITPARSSMLIVTRYLTAGGIGLATGLSLGFALVMFLGAIDNRLFTPWDIEQISDIELIGSIADDKKMFNSNTIFQDITQLKTHNAIMETLGMLDLKNIDNESILMVTGAGTGEGKTTISLQIASALAHDKRAKVLLIDANFSTQELTKGLLASEDQPKGLIDVLSDNVAIHDVLQTTVFENLDFIPAGTIKQRESAGFYHKSLCMAMDSVRKEYDLIIIDTPGLLKSVDAALFAAEANYILMVIKAGVTRRETFLNAEHMLHRTDNKIIGALLNFRKHPVPQIFYGQE